MFGKMNKYILNMVFCKKFYLLKQNTKKSHFNYLSLSHAKNNKKWYQEFKQPLTGIDWICVFWIALINTNLIKPRLKPVEYIINYSLTLLMNLLTFYSTVVICQFKVKIWAKGEWLITICYLFDYLKTNWYIRWILLLF